MIWGVISGQENKTYRVQQKLYCKYKLAKSLKTNSIEC